MSAPGQKDKSHPRLMSVSGARTFELAGITSVNLTILARLPNVRFGSRADIAAELNDVGFTPGSGHS
jgi:hypothetical protein